MISVFEPLLGCEKMLGAFSNAHNRKAIALSDLLLFGVVFFCVIIPSSLFSRIILWVFRLPHAVTLIPTTLIAEWSSSWVVFNNDHVLSVPMLSWPYSSAPMVLIWATVMLAQFTFAGGYWDSWIHLCFSPCDLLCGFDFSIYSGMTARMFWHPPIAKVALFSASLGSNSITVFSSEWVKQDLRQT